MSLIKENAQEIITYSVIASFVLGVYLSDERKVHQLSQLHITEQELDKIMGVPENVSAFQYVDNASGKKIPVYVQNESTYSMIKDAMDFMKEKKPEEFHSILNKVEMIKTEDRIQSDVWMPGSYEFMSVHPAKSIVYINESLLKKYEFDNKTIGCGILHEKTHLDLHGEIRAYMVGYLCSI